jgi:hypothetical protein
MFSLLFFFFFHPGKPVWLNKNRMLTMLFYYVYSVFHLILAAWTYFKEEKNRKSQRELRKEAKNIELEDRMRPQNDGPPVVVPVDNKTVMVQD